MAQGRCSAMVVVVLLLVSAAAVAQGATYIVGDATQWTVPTTLTFYADWASNKTFVAGDTLIFKYTAARHNVVIVSTADYNSCTLTSTNKVQTGNDSLILVAGANSYLCGIPSHCTSGQKLTVTASAAPGPTNPITPPTPTTPTSPGSNGASGSNTVTVLQVLAAVMVSVVASLAL